jgi:hypothetical protein
MRRIIPILLLLCASSVFGQSCTTATCNAASASEVDILAALPSTGNTNATVTVNIPTSTASWTGGITYTIPSAVTTLIIQGATTVTCTGTSGTSSYACSATDNSVIADSWNNGTGQALITINTGAASSYLRITGLTFKGGSSTQSKYGLVTIQGNSQHVRQDHSHYNNETYPSGVSTAWVQWNGRNQGVLDHNLVDMSTCNGSSGTSCSGYTSNGFRANNPVGDFIGNGDGTFMTATPWGTAAAMFIEDNVFNGGAPNDCAAAGFFVMRHNTLNDNYVAVQTHGTKTPAGPARGCRGYEAYNNYFTGPGSPYQASSVVGAKGGTALIWGNTMAANTAYRFSDFGGDRESGDEGETNTPNGWGYCGTTVNGNGVGSPWDGNNNTGTGKPCLDGIGRGQQTQAMNGAAFPPASPSRLNSVTGTIAWPHQYLEPMYYWNNTINGATYLIWGDQSVNNLDFYYDQSAQSGSFTGAAGTGSGLLSARPSTCTAGPGGTYNSSPTGSYGVGYWATDTNTFYVCDGSPANHWAAIYQPYTYPHPLVAGGPPQVSLPSFSPSSGVPPQTVTTTDSTGGATLCGRNDGGTPTATTAGTCDGSPTFTITGTQSVTVNPTTLTAIGTEAGYVNSSVASATYSGSSPAATPVWTPASGAYPYGYAITLATSTYGCTPYIWWGASNPPTTSNYNTQALNNYYAGTYYAKVIGCPGYSDSGVATATYAISSGATFSPTSLSAPGYVTLAGTGAIYYTTDGTTPTTLSAVYQYPLYVQNSQTIKALASGVVGSQAYTIPFQATNFGLMRGANSQTMPTSSGMPVDPLYDRMQPATGVEVRQISPTRGTYNWTNYDAWVSSITSHGGKVYFTRQANPNWMTGLNDSTTDGPPTDLNTSAACLGVLTGTTTTDCTMKEWETAHMMHVTGLSSQPSSPVSCPNLSFDESGNEVNTYSGSYSIVGWSSTPSTFVQMMNDRATIIHEWCLDTKVLIGSVSSIWGANGTGNPQYDVYTAEEFTLIGPANAGLYQGVAFHNYGCRTTTVPTLPPTASTGTNSCYVSQANQVTQFEAVALQQSSTVSWSGHLPVYISEGGFGEVNQLNGDNTSGVAYMSELPALVASAPGAGASNYYPPVTDMLYLGWDTNPTPTTNQWGCLWKCGPTGTASPWYQALVQVTAWEAAATSAGACVTSSITGGTMWRCPLNGGTSEIDWCAVPDTSTCTTTTAFNTQQAASSLVGGIWTTGAVSSTGGVLTLGPISELVYNSGGSIAATPTFAPAAGTYPSTRAVTISDTTPSSTITYCTDTTNTCTPSTTYTTTISVSSTEYVRASATAIGYAPSSIASALYTIVAPPPTALQSTILYTSGVN